MPEHLDPGVHVDETSFRSKSIEGVSTAITGMVGPCRSGPTGVVSGIITSLAEFEHVYGDGRPLTFGTNYLWHGARAFFGEGGRRLYVVRVSEQAGVAELDPDENPTKLEIRARHGGVSGNVAIELTPEHRPITRTEVGGGLAPPGLRTGDVVRSGDDHVVVTDPTAAITGDVVTLTLVVRQDARTWTWTGISPEPTRPSVGGPDSIASVCSEAATPDVPIVISVRDAAATGATIATAIGDGLTVTLTGGSDGTLPTASAYARALESLEAVEDISIVAAPGSTSTANTANSEAIQAALVTHARSTRYRVALLDAPESATPDAALDHRRKFDSSHAAFYYPWITTLDPITNHRINLPPSGFVAGIYARSDIERGVWKAPANQVVHLAIGFERDVTDGQHSMLNPAGVNCFRTFEGRGRQLWGARTTSSVREWKYLNVRRYVNYLERSIELGTQWAVFEPNGEPVWGKVRQTISDFLLEEWRRGALLGDKPERAFFVRCDRSTMTQNDIDNGRLVCLIGVCPLRPAEFVIFRIGHRLDHDTE